MATQDNFSFSNRFYNAIPNAYQQTKAEPFSDNHLVCVSEAALKALGIELDYSQTTEFLGVITGQKVPKQGYSIAQVYAGHQFGHYVEQLGDGRAIGIGEIETSNKQHYELQLKGAGRTPYSRHGDGRAVLRSTIREYLASEAMVALNIPTTRALAMSSTTDVVYREQPEHGAILTRFAESHLRFGHFEYFFHNNDKSTLNQLAQFCLTHYFPEQNQEENKYLAMLTEIVKRTARLIAKWQSVGFTHGVMNTDNMSILGLTIDYGPFGFIDEYQPSYVSNQSDHQARYAFEQQPSIGLWNLNALAYTFSTWLSVEEIKHALGVYEIELVHHYNYLMQQKLGFSQWLESDSQLTGRLLAIMANQQADYTNTFRRLNEVSIDDSQNEHCQSFLSLFNHQTAISEWLSAYRQRLIENTYSEEVRIKQQNQINPKYILRNYLAENAINAAKTGDYSEISLLQTLLGRPFDEQIKFQAYANNPPKWSKEIAISCSS